MRPGRPPAMHWQRVGSCTGGLVLARALALAGHPKEGLGCPPRMSFGRCETRGKKKDPSGYCWVETVFVKFRIVLPVRCEQRQRQNGHRSWQHVLRQRTNHRSFTYPAVNVTGLCYNQLDTFFPPSTPVPRGKSEWAML